MAWPQAPHLMKKRPSVRTVLGAFIDDFVIFALETNSLFGYFLFFAPRLLYRGRCYCVRHEGETTGDAAAGAGAAANGGRGGDAVGSFLDGRS